MDSLWSLHSGEKRYWPKDHVDSLSGPKGTYSPLSTWVVVELGCPLNTVENPDEGDIASAQGLTQQYLAFIFKHASMKLKINEFSKALMRFASTCALKLTLE